MKIISRMKVGEAKYLKIGSFMLQYSRPKPSENDKMELIE